MESMPATGKGFWFDVLPSAREPLMTKEGVTDLVYDYVRIHGGSMHKKLMNELYDQYKDIKNIIGDRLHAFLRRVGQT